MTSKERTVKIKANKDIEGVITEGTVYDASEIINYYVFKNDRGEKDYAHKSHFTVVGGAEDVFRAIINADRFHIGQTPDWVVTKPKQGDEPTIEVGSEWVDHKGAVLTVSHVGKNLLIYTWNESGREFASSIKNHLKFYKPKPKTVTMYFYRQHTERLFASEFPPNFTETLFTREIELP